MQVHSASIPNYLATIVRYWDLVRALVAREFSARYRGSMAGVFWAVANPILTVLMFTFIFSTVFKARWGVQQSSNADFVVIAMIGMIIHGMFVEALGRAPTLILGQPSYVKKVVFPLEILPITAILGALINAGLTFAVVMLADFLIHGSIPLTVLLLPIVMAPFILLMTGIVLFFSSIGVYFRDLSQIVTFIGMVALFLAPIFYPITVVPEHYRWLLYFNPLTFIVEQARGVALFGELPDWIGLAWYSVGAFAFTWLGLVWFQRTRKGFADVI